MPKESRVAILISDKVDFKPKTLLWDEEGHYIILKGSIQQEDLTVINIYAPNLGSVSYINQLITKLKQHIDNNIIIVGDFNTPLKAMYISSKQINKETRALNDRLDQMERTRWTSKIYTEHSILKQQNTHSSQVH